MSVSEGACEEARIDDRLTGLLAAGMRLCSSLAHLLNESSMLAACEPGGDISELDVRLGLCGHEVLGDPVKATHQMMTAYTCSAGELLWAVAALLASSGGFVVAPGAMTRSVAVYSARAFRLSDPRLEPVERCNLFLHFIKAGWMPDANARAGLIRDIDGWISKHGLGKPRDIGQEERLVASMFDEEADRQNRLRSPGERKRLIRIDDNFYGRLSRLVHGDPTTLLAALVASQEYPLVNRLDVLLDSLVSLVTAYKAGNRVNDLRGGNIERYDEIYYALGDLVTSFREVRVEVETAYQIRLRTW